MKEYITFLNKGNVPFILTESSLFIDDLILSYDDKKTNVKRININKTEKKEIIKLLSKKIGYSFDSIFHSLDRNYSLNELNNYNAIGNNYYRLIKHFHKSLLLSNKKGKLSQFDGINNKQIREAVILNRIIYGKKNLDVNALLDGLTISLLAPRPSIFSPHKAKIIINDYAIGKEITDPFSGFSGRMIGTLLCGKHYRGSDIRSQAIYESNEILFFLKKRADIITSDFKQSWNKGDTLFTCPPYGEKEKWPGVENYETEDFYIDWLLSNTKFKRYIFVVKETKYKNNIVKEIKNGSWYKSSSNEKILIF